MRKYFTTQSTIGELFVDGVFRCYVLEDVARPVGVKIKGATCIPEGKYKVKTTFSFRYQKPMPLVYNSPDLKVKDGRGKEWEGIRDACCPG